MIGSVLGDALDLYQRFFWRFVGTAAAVFVVLDLLSAILGSTSGEHVVAAVFWGLVTLLATIVGLFWVQGALVEAVQDVRDDRIDTTIGELYERTRPRLPALVAAGLVAAIAIAVGTVLLVIPGLFLLTRWVLLVPVIVLERRAAGEAFARSWELVKGHSWPAFGLIVVTLIGSGVAHGLLRAIFSFLPDFFASWLGGLIADSLVIPFVALAWTLLYYRLADRPEPAAPAV